MMSQIHEPQEECRRMTSRGGQDAMF
jgi:hypothetical protein